MFGASNFGIKLWTSAPWKSRVGKFTFGVEALGISTFEVLTQRGSAMSHVTDIILIDPAIKYLGPNMTPPASHVTQSFMTSRSNYLYRPKVMVHLHVVRNTIQTCGHKVMQKWSGFKAYQHIFVEPQILVYVSFRSRKIIVTVKTIVCRAGLKGWWHIYMHAVRRILNLFKLLGTSI